MRAVGLVVIGGPAIGAAGIAGRRGKSVAAEATEAEAEPFQRLFENLPDALTGQVQLPADVGQVAAVAVVAGQDV